MKNLLLVLLCCASTRVLAPDYTRLVDDELEAMWADANKHLTPSEVLIRSANRLEGAFDKLDESTRKRIMENWTRFARTETTQLLKWASPAIVLQEIKQIVPLCITPFRPKNLVGPILFNERMPMLDFLHRRGGSGFALTTEAQMFYDLRIQPSGPSSRYNSEDASNTEFRAFLLASYYEGTTNTLAHAAKLSGITPENELIEYGRLIADPYKRSPEFKRALEDRTRVVFRENPVLNQKYKAYGSIANRLKKLFSSDLDLRCKVVLGQIARKPLTLFTGEKY